MIIYEAFQLPLKSSNSTGKSCDETRSKCDNIYQKLSKVEEDCRAHQIYLNCLQVLNGLCRANLRFWLMYSTTEKFLTEKCSHRKFDSNPDDSNPALFNPHNRSPPLSNDNLVNLKDYQNSPPTHLSSCLSNLLQISAYNTPKYLNCVILPNNNIINYHQRRQSCRLNGARPLLTNRFLTIQVSSHQVLDNSTNLTISVISELSIVLKPDRKCLDHSLQLPAVIYRAFNTTELPQTLVTGSAHFTHKSITIKLENYSDQSGYCQIQLWLSHLNTRIVITRYRLMHTLYSLSAVILIPDIVAHSQPYSAQQGLVMDLCSDSCLAHEQIDETQLTDNTLAHQSCINTRPRLLTSMLYDACVANSLALIVPNKQHTFKVTFKQLIYTPLLHTQSIIQYQFNMSIDKHNNNSRNKFQFQPFLPKWKMTANNNSNNMLSAKSNSKSTSSSQFQCDSFLIILLSLLVLRLLSNSPSPAPSSSLFSNSLIR